MLDTLRSIIQAVNDARNLEQALSIIVTRVKGALDVDVCSVYLASPESGEMVLMATDGLRPDAIGTVRLEKAQGLVGLVAERAEPLNLDNAVEHPSYCYFEETGEEQYHGFLGVPIIHHRQVLGVLVLQQRNSKRYHEDVVTFVVTIAAQLAGAIAHAEVSGGIEGLTSQQTQETLSLKGLPGAPGVAIGRAVILRQSVNIDSIPDQHVEDPATEKRRFLEAVKAVKDEVRAMVDNMGEALPTADSALFDAYLLMLDSHSLVQPVLDGIAAGNWAPGALREVANEHIRLFREMEDPYLRERAEDIRDLSRRLLQALKQRPEAKRKRRYPRNTVLVGEEISASMLAEIPPKSLAGVVSMRGSITSHTAILARALGIPAVMGVDDLPVSRIGEHEVVVDGYAGRVYINPPAAIKKEFRHLLKEEQEFTEGLRELRDLPAVCEDGFRIPLYANTGLLSDIAPSLNSGAEGIGLYRTEFPFMVREHFPGEESQRVLYRKVLEAFHPRPVTMRTLDVGGDKALPYFPIVEDNPFLGWRGIRITLDHPEIFITQIRAMLLANAGLGNLQLLLPMITTLDEFTDASALILRAHSELLEDGHLLPLPPVGAMVEVPSIVYQAEKLAERADFLSIGTNDLTQYLLAVDRNNPRVAELYDSLHPSVLQAIQMVIEGAKRHKTPVSICGEMAGDPLAALLLLGMGVNSLSMASSALPRIKWVIRSFSRRQARALLKKALQADSAKTVRFNMNRALDKAGLGGLVRAGK
ncbi:MAG: phosphoenolpyruvate--protein phosphotransferase [Chromatiales bacterium]|nr:phosphoenolpyruvate--protein phosphotransferase [Chromatiales bacterium]